MQTSPHDKDRHFLSLAIAEARAGRAQGGIPIGACLVDKHGNVLGVGRNKRVQEKSAIKHGETDCLENVGRLPASVYKGATMYTTLSPCDMCTGSILLYGIPRIVMGENATFKGGEDYMRSRGVEVVNLDSQECKDLMKEFIEAEPSLWNEDIGEEDEAKEPSNGAAAAVEGEELKKWKKELKPKAAAKRKTDDTSAEPAPAKRTSSRKKT